ncbi:MAG TPA: toxin-antitoxin system YwqK family antitoxin [Bacteroidales bacterium]|nr:toxin-antitoxin system YwqK family antitoxin [Bacteroidales bacterium]
MEIHCNREKVRIIPFLVAFLFAIGLLAQKPVENAGEPLYKETPQLFQSGRLYYIDRAQTRLYTGDYREYHDNGTLKLEMQLRNGQPEGTYIVYYENRKPKEVRSYKEGKLHGLWRSYDPSGQLISEAEYRNGLKHGTWRIWDELGNLRYEMNYRDGKKVGNWRMWNERGELVDEKQF